MKQNKKFYNAAIILLLLIAIQPLRANDILRILEGYGRDSIATFSTRDAHTEAARLFNLILEPNGKVTAEKAEEYLNTAESNVIKAYLAVMLADYAFVNNAYDSGIRYLKRAVDEHDPIRNDSYYRAVLSRAQKDIGESPGKTKENKTSVLAQFNPKAVISEPAVKTITPDTSVTVTKTQPAEQDAIKTPPAIIPVPAPNFRIQVGAFSVRENALLKKIYFEERGYTVHVDEQERTSGYLYIVRVGAYQSYDEAKTALYELKNRFPKEDGIVVKVTK